MGLFAIANMLMLPHVLDQVLCLCMLGVRDALSTYDSCVNIQYRA